MSSERRYRNEIAKLIAKSWGWLVGGRLKTGQWWSIQNQPLIWLVKRVRVVLARGVFVLSWIVFAGD